MPELTVPWGREELHLSLPEHWEVRNVAWPNLRDAPDDWPDRLAAALNTPATGKPLARLLKARRDGRIAILVEDATRHSPVPEILRVIMREIRHAQIDDEQIEIVFCTGMHPPMTPAETADKLGEVAERIRCRSNPWHDESAYTSVGDAGGIDVRIDTGVVTANLRIIVSAVTPHLQAGFGGGYKMLLPGCAHLETIRALHRLGLGRTYRPLVGTSASKNPMRSAIDSAGLLVDSLGGASFGVFYLLDEKDRPSSVAAGEVLPTQRMTAKQCAVSCGVVVDEPVDVAIASSHPRDYDLWQCFKAIPNTLSAVRPGGVLICLARCEAGLHGFRPIRWPISPKWTRRAIRALGPEALGSLLMRFVPRLAGDAAFFVRLALQTVHRNHVFMVSPSLYNSIGRFPGLALMESPEEAFLATEEVLGASAKRVAVFPSGGTTFAILPNESARRGA